MPQVIYLTTEETWSSVDAVSMFVTVVLVAQAEVVVIATIQSMSKVTLVTDTTLEAALWGKIHNSMELSHQEIETFIGCFTTCFTINKNNPQKLQHVKLLRKLQYETMNIIAP